MKEKLINNMWLKILSIFLAFLVWLVVMNVSNPEVTRTKEVSLEIENEQVLTAARKTFEVIGKNTVTVSYEVRARDEYKIRATDFRAYIDLTELYDITGSVPIKVEILNNKEIISSASAKPGSVRVEMEDLQRKRFDLQVVQSGAPGDGYAVNEITLKPNYVYVSGPISLVGQISYVGVKIDLADSESDMAGTAAPVFFDANDNELPLDDRVTVNTPTIDYTITIYRVKNLNLDFEVSGTVAEDFQFVGAESDIKTVSVQGPKTTLASLNKITIPAAVLNIEGATSDRKVTVELQQYLPEGVTIVGSSDIAEVLLKVEMLESREFVLTHSSIAIQGGNDNYQYILVPDTIELTVQGLSEDLDSLVLSDFGAALDVSEFEPGNTYPVDLVFNRSDVFEVIFFTEAKVITAYDGEDVPLETMTDGEVENPEESDLTESENDIDVTDGETTKSAESTAEGS